MSKLYRVQVAEQLDPAWSAWLHNLTIRHHHDGSTRLVGRVADHETLVKVLVKVVALGATLVALEPVRAVGEAVVVEFSCNQNVEKERL